ncbi:hypothetical protein AB0K43_13100 [Kitasatospora sp. NPDC049258]|uniref:hypothetical protein n=1 Tax=Kitasatospora sp. NPDC049258 TaxID=3155394 RepID=UPI00344031F2
MITLSWPPGRPPPHPASATPAPVYDCTTGQICLHDNSGSYGYDAHFVQETPIANHAAAVDRWTDLNFAAHYNSAYDCRVACRTIAPYTTVDLNASLENTIASGPA